MRFLLLLVLMAGCASTSKIRHYSGVSTGSSDNLMGSMGGGTRANPWHRVDATFEMGDTTAILYVYSLEYGRSDTLVFHKRDSTWHWAGAPLWKAPATITQSNDSLYVAFGWGYGGESFYLKQDR